MTKHTPGPWRLDTPDMAHVVEHDYHSIKAGVGFLAEKPEAAGFGLAGHMTLADARLIAAAPELLEALVACVDALDRIRIRGGFDTAAELLARTAIAKATGNLPPAEEDKKA